MKVERIKLAELTPDPDNAKDHPAWQVEQIKASIEQFGNLDPIGVWGPQNLIVEGHGRYEALKELGYQEAEVIRLDQLTDEERRAYALAHNQTTLTSGFDPDLLKLNLDSIQEIDMSLFGFNVIDADIKPHIEEDEVPENPPKICKDGDLWQLGGHKLKCGDCTSTDNVEHLMGGVQADIAITSPPYGESDSAKLRDHYVKGNKKRTSLYNKHEDNSKEWGGLMSRAFDNMKKASAAQFVNIQMLAANKRSLIDFISDNADALVDIIIWDKKTAAPQMQKNILNNQFEFIFVFSQKNGSRSIPFGNFHGNTSNIITLSRGQNKYADIHRAVFPIEFPAKIMEIASKAETVLDLFGGTGTTLMACEQMGRRCYMMEMDPRYCDVIIERWERLTGKKAVLIDG